MAKRVIALDIGGVCMSIHPERCFGAIGYRSMEEIPPELVAAASQSFERGELSEPAFLEMFHRLSGSTLPGEALRAAFLAIIGEPLPGMSELVLSLPGRGFRPVFFSDTSSLHLAEVRRKFPGAAAVPEGVYSFEVGAKKPELPMFAAFEAKYGVPEFYFDDRAELIAAARKHGWNAHRTTSAGEIDKILG